MNMQSPDFNPPIKLNPDVIRNLTIKAATPVNMFTKETPDELNPR